MGKLLYIATTSVDGYIADAQGNFDWTAPDDERHLFINDLVARAGTQLMGRRMYDTLAVWEDPAFAASDRAAMAAYHRIWLASDKVVYSRTLAAPRSARTTILRDFDAGAVRDMKAAAPKDLSIGGSDLASQVLRVGLVDEIHLFVVPYLAGSGKQVLREGITSKLKVLADRRFGDGAYYTAYSIGS